LCITFHSSLSQRQYIQMNPTNNLELHKYSSYSSGLYFSALKINTLRIQLLDDITREITHPRLSLDFVSGILEDSKNRGYFRASCITGIEFLRHEESPLPELVFSRKAIGEQLLEVKFPTELNVRYQGPWGSSQRIRALGMFRGFVFTDSHLRTAIPLAALASIETKCA
jgi:hypothetical protein